MHNITVYRLSYYTSNGEHVEIHYPKKSEAIKDYMGFVEKCEEENISSIELEELKILPATKKNICLFLDGHSYVESRKTLFSEER